MNSNDRWADRKYCPTTFVKWRMSLHHGQSCNSSGLAPKPYTFSSTWRENMAVTVRATLADSSGIQRGGWQPMRKVAWREDRDDYFMSLYRQSGTVATLKLLYVDSRPHVGEHVIGLWYWIVSQALCTEDHNIIFHLREVCLTWYDRF